MRRGLILVLGVLVAVLMVTAASAVSCTLSACPGFPPQVTTFGASVSPEKLPWNDYVPVTANIFGKISTTDGTHPSALREAVIDIDKDVKINVRGYPVCEGGSRDIRDPHAAEKVCGNTILDRGRAEIEIAFPAQKPIKVTSPVTTVTISRKDNGLHAVAKVPTIAGGSGSLIGFSSKLGKTYSYKGKKVGYLEAKCPNGVFKVGFPSLLFRNEAHTPGQEASFNLKGKLAVPCTPYG